MKKTNHSSGFYKDILDHMIEGCQILGFDWRYLYLNQTAEQHNRRPNEELMGNLYCNMWPGIKDTNVYGIIKDSLENRVPHSLENEFTFPDGSVGWFELRISPVPEGVFIMSLDITARKRTELALKKTAEQLQQSTKLEAIGQLAGGVAHDFNNILGVILGHVEMAMEKTLPESSVYADLNQIHLATLRSAELTRQLLAFARRQTMDLRIVNVNQLVEGFLKLLGRLIGEDISLLWIPGDNLYSVLMDPSQVEQILTNLCINARDAISGVGQVTIETRNVSIDEVYCSDHPGFHPGEFVVLSVSDNGSGMEKELLDKIFEPFFTTKAMGYGTGLGLATVYGIVKQNNGFINVYSEPGRGTTFRIYLSRDKGTAVAVAAAAGTEYISRGSETILLVEDESGILKMVKTMLERMGYHVLPALKPSEAVQLAQKYPSPIHLLLTDVIMPEMTGPELAKQVQAISPQTKLLFTSGYTANVIARRGVLKRGVHFLPKPFSRQQLGLKIREALIDDTTPA